MNKNRSFEEAITRLEEIVRLLENGAQSLEESLKLFEEGTVLAAQCNTTLTRAKLKISELTPTENEQDDGMDEKNEEEPHDD